jgi:hypothetical protein
MKQIAVPLRKLHQALTAPNPDDGNLPVSASIDDTRIAHDVVIAGDGCA